MANAKKEGDDVQRNLNLGVAEKDPPSLQHDQSGVGKRQKSCYQDKCSMIKIMSVSPSSSQPLNTKKIDETAGTSTHKRGQEGRHDDQDGRKLQILAQVASEKFKEDFPVSFAAGEKSFPPQQDRSCVEKRPRSSTEKSSTKRRVSLSYLPQETSNDVVDTCTDKGLQKRRRVEVDGILSLSQVGSYLLKQQFPEAYAALNASKKSRHPVLQPYRSGVKMRSTKKRVSPFSLPATNSNKLLGKATLQETSVSTMDNVGGTSTDKRLQRKVAGIWPPPPAGRTWRDVHRDMAGGMVLRIGEKTVRNSDKDLHQSRLLLPLHLKAQVYNYATRSERMEIDSDAGLQVEVLDYCGHRYEMRCKYRGTQKGLVFNSGWRCFLQQHGELHLPMGESLLILAFRSKNGRLCFVFLPRHLQADQELH